MVKVDGYGLKSIDSALRVCPVDKWDLAIEDWRRKLNMEVEIEGEMVKISGKLKWQMMMKMNIENVLNEWEMKRENGEWKREISLM